MSENAAEYLDRVTPELEAALRALKLNYDTRAYVAVLAIEAARTYADLKAAGVENEMSIARIFRYLEKVAQEKPEREPKLITTESETAH